MRRSWRSGCLLALLLLPAVSQAWWNDSWAYRKQLTLDTTAAGANIPSALTNVPVLVRLHSGNFHYFLDMQPGGGDMRFVAGDDQTPLKYAIESFDPVNEMAMVWVQLPTLAANANTETLWMYYGNNNAASGEEPTGIFDVNTTAVLHFDGDATVQKDASAYGNNPVIFTATPLAGALIAGGASFDGSQRVQLPDVPTLRGLPDSGWTFSAWFKPDAEQADTVLMQREDSGRRLTLGMSGLSAYVRLRNADDTVLETARNTQLTPATWHHLAVVTTAGRVSLFLDGVETAYLETPIGELGGAINIGSPVEGATEAGFNGEIDEVEISNIARSPQWLRATTLIQGPQSSLVVYGEDGKQEAEGGSSYFGVILANVTVDGWAVIVLLAIMAAISWLVMIAKTVVVKRIAADNAAFLGQFQRLGRGQVGDLDRAETAADEQARESSVLLALSGGHDHFQSSTLYRIYHAGVQEVQQRQARSLGAAAFCLSPQAVDVIKATMDATLVRENQRLNAQMVLLTIAISGGPFLGLLGTVVGVMITFAAIAASGDVNVNAIAPGIAAALVATVAGLAVAIPALFGYNWLGSKIKEISADMQVFVDEFITKVAEQHGEIRG